MPEVHGYMTLSNIWGIQISLSNSMDAVKYRHVMGDKVDPWSDWMEIYSKPRSEVEECEGCIGCDEDDWVQGFDDNEEFLPLCEFMETDWRRG